MTAHELFEQLCRLAARLPLAFWVFLALLSVCVALLQTLRLSFAGWQRRRRLSDQAQHAVNAELRAAELLQELGYTIVGAQVQRSYSLWLEGEEFSIVVRADYIVKRQGQVFVAEVKSGRFAPSIENAATRRQVLEYLVAFRVDGALLIDAELCRVSEVLFPGFSRPLAARSKAY